jgi:hypothetical protein
MVDLALVLVLLLGPASGSLSASGSGRFSAGKPTSAEQFLIDRVSAGKVADLRAAFSNETDRVIRGAFLEEILTGARKDCSVHRNGVLIEGAVVRGAVDLRNVEISHDTRLSRCVFEDEINFSKSAFENSFSVEGSGFKREACFYSMKVGRGMSIEGAEFRGHANFSQMDVQGVFGAGAARFLHSTRPAEFIGCKAGGNAFFTNVLFAGPVTFQYAQFADNLKLDGARFTNAAELVSFESMKVVGMASLTGAVFRGYVSFKDSAFNTLDLSDIQWPRHVYGEWLWLNGTSYQRILAGSEKDSPDHLLTLLDLSARRSAYSTDVYTGLVEFYRREGYIRQANRFFIAQKRREREEVLRGSAWCWNLFLDWFVGYGRGPERAIFWSAAIVLVGIRVFRPGNMEPRLDNAKPDCYSPFWYSVDLFLPLVKLQDAELWKPKDAPWFPRFWSRIHTMLGWALIPIAVAAWTGMLEK